MNDLISRQTAIETAENELESGTFYDIPMKLKRLPSAEPEAVKIYNIEIVGKYTFASCGACSAPVVSPDKYCSECGAKLDWSKDEDAE